jgi:ABC-type polysaccharide/polyol phosphate transport system ATPase subunit
MPVIEVDAVSKAFWIPTERRDTVREHLFGVLRRRAISRLQVLDRVSFAVERGEALGIMGRNGSGKSTLLKIVSGVYTADSGLVHTRADVTPILELGVGWNPELDAIDNVMLIGALLGRSLDDIRTGLREILAFADVERFAHLPLKHFSSGMSARLAYAVAFHAVREVLVLDEIFAVGDAGFRAQCEQRYHTLRAEGRTVIIVSHDPRTISTFCDRALLLDGGRIVMDAAAPAVASRYVSLLTEPVA